MQKYRRESIVEADVVGVLKLEVDTLVLIDVEELVLALEYVENPVVVGVLTLVDVDVEALVLTEVEILVDVEAEVEVDFDLLVDVEVDTLVDTEVE